MLAKTAVKSIAKGKLDLGDVYDIVDGAKTLVSKDATMLDRGEALFNILSPVSTKEAKAVDKFLGIADDVKDAGKLKKK